jgi:ribosomal protein L16 Arg81 hydroxylase
MTAPVNAPPGAPLAKLVAPELPTAFRDRYWDRRSCHLRAPGRSWDDLGVTVEAVVAAVAARRAQARIVTTEGDDDVTTPVHGSVALPLPAGSTLCVNHVDRVFPGVAALCRAILNGFGLAGTAFSNLYYSAEGHGFTGHFDTQAVFVVQLAGAKIWRFGPAPDVVWPPVGCTETPAALADFRAEYPTVPLAGPGALTEVRLEPGDVLFLPAGTWHRARAAGGPSLALAVTVLPANAWELITRVLEPALRADPEWRRDVAAPPDGPVDGLSPEVERHLLDRLEALRRHLAEITPADLHRAWRLRRGSVERTRWEGDALDPEAVLGHASGLAPGYQRDGDALQLIHAGCVVELDAAAEPFVRALSQQGRFRAGDAAAWDPELEWDDVAALLETLLREGVLEIA